MKNYEIIFQDQHLAVVNKSAGLLSQGDHGGDKSLVDFLREDFGRNYVGLVHRLDRKTSGLLVVAKRSKAANRLTESLKKKTLQRVYWALLRGKITSSGKLESFLKKDEKTNQSQVVASSVPESKKAVLDYKVIKSLLIKEEHISLVEVKLQTGRSHQIRVQFSHLGHPLLGDLKYGGSLKFVERPALHAASLTFPHPMSGEVLSFQAEAPQDFKKLLNNS